VSRGDDVTQFSIRTECVFLIIGLRRRCVTEMSAELLCDICDSSSSQTHASKCGIVYVLNNIYSIKQTIEQINCLPRDWRPLHYNDAKNVPLIPRKPILHYIFHPLAGRESLCVCVYVYIKCTQSPPPSSCSSSYRSTLRPTDFSWRADFYFSSPDLIPLPTAPTPSRPVDNGRYTI